MAVTSAYAYVPRNDKALPVCCNVLYLIHIIAAEGFFIVIHEVR